MLCVFVELSFCGHESLEEGEEEEEDEEEDLTGGVGRSDGPIRDAAGARSPTRQRGRQDLSWNSPLTHKSSHTPTLHYHTAYRN